MEDELERLEQEAKDEQVQDLTNKMLDTGSVPVSDQMQRVPAAPTGESKLQTLVKSVVFNTLTRCNSQENDTHDRGRGACRAAAGHELIDMSAHCKLRLRIDRGGQNGLQRTVRQRVKFFSHSVKLGKLQEGPFDLWRRRTKAAFTFAGGNRIS